MKTSWNGITVCEKFEVVGISHDIDVGDSKPVKQHPYRLNPLKLEHLRKEINYMLENDIIEPNDISDASVDGQHMDIEFVLAISPETNMFDRPVKFYARLYEKLAFCVIV
ncbi:Hypothetical predicted protein [Octopus vulgaris]|uniref:Uncharacterized protein n=1 Tax=Octopus vulgaris TaxID=6645 RepID=A0AA36B5D1_OCTVU|nr:Hypothetical predicted protein [Octopus vulgaris]